MQDEPYTFKIILIKINIVNNFIKIIIFLIYFANIYRNKLTTPNEKIHPKKLEKCGRIGTFVCKSSHKEE